MKKNGRSREKGPRSHEDFSGFFTLYAIKFYMFGEVNINSYFCTEKSSTNLICKS